MSRKRKPRVSVLCFYADGTKNKYRFNSEPDLDRVQKEAREDKVSAAIVFDRKRDGVCVVAPYAQSFYEKSNTGAIIVFLTRLFQNPATCDKIVTEAIIKVPAESEHYDGEPCNLPIYKLDAENAKGLRYEYMSNKKQHITKDSWFVTDEDDSRWGEECYICKWISYNKTEGEYYPLRAIPVEEKK